MIPPAILEKFGATRKILVKTEVLFEEGTDAHFYYQIINGEIKVLNWSEEGKEFIQGIFSDGQGLGEPPLLGRFPYPATAMATMTTEVYKLSYQAMIALLQDNFDIHLKLTHILSNRLQYKAMIMKDMSTQDAEHRIVSMLSYLKKKEGIKGVFEVNLTRQNLADLTGLRVETVIRTIKLMQEQKKLKIKGRKIWFE
ncbi:Crp/Fnr family transcriptional regulator [Arcicella aquatica]|uniref:Crp/Fnr family transcriptional regulator n=1 Tax=Arcicella aquatica TaxID=217141 RepID=A0ABU5QM48_9BACT|nr:Crp/Fnr family transcriptional regulator [Arcicella aquatica]MEA5257860.1 Crp/Fnr family transcriptional regulator [Arcicella aquatica]